MESWIITVLVVVFVVVVIIISLFCCYRHIKKKIRNKLIDKGADIVTTTAGKFLDEETASKVNNATNVTAKVLKGGKTDLMLAAAKKGLELAKDRKEKQS